jgi:hypothetical protein
LYTRNVWRNWNFPVPLVKVDDNSQGQPQVFGFFERPWKIADNGEKPAYQYTKAPGTLFSFLRPPSLPEKLSEYWRNKLETELRSRKYSPRTQHAYIYYNRLICRTLQKTPEELCPDDVTQFLADMEKDREYSASALNLAISGIKFFFRNVLKNDDISEQYRMFGETV